MHTLTLLGFAAVGTVLIVLGHEDVGLLLIGVAVPTSVRRDGGSA